jgi:acyl-CoA thioesterase-1
MSRVRANVSGFLAAIVAATTACGSASHTPTAADRPERRIVVLGDSLAVSPTRSENFASELQARLSATHPGWTIDNQGVSGDTTADGLRRVDTALTSGVAIVILELGANDGLRGVPIAAVEDNLGRMIERAQARDIHVLLCGMEAPPFNGLSYSVEFHRVFPRLAARYHLPLVPFLLQGVVLNRDLNGDDDVQPKAAGARVIAGTVWPYLEAMVEALATR